MANGTPGGGPTVVTLDDRGKTIQLAVGQSFLLKLGETFDWTVNISDQTVISRVRNIMVVRGAQGVYDALKGKDVFGAAKSDLEALVKSLAKEKTILFSTHILQEVEALADRIVIINEGKLVACGTKAELAARVQNAGKAARDLSLEEIFIGLLVPSQGVSA